MNQDPTGNKPLSSSKPPVYIPPVRRPGQTPPMYHPPSEPLHEQLAPDGKTSLEKREHPDSANRQTGPAAASKSPAAPPASQPDAPTPGTVPAVPYWWLKAVLLLIAAGTSYHILSFKTLK